MAEQSIEAYTLADTGRLNNRVNLRLLEALPT